MLVIHPGLGVFGMSQGDWHRAYEAPQGWREDNLGLIAEAIEVCANAFPELVLAVENMIFPHEIFPTPQDLQLLIQQVKAPKVGVCLDVGHATAANQDWKEFFSVLGERIMHLHVHDNCGFVDEHLPIGQGNIDYLGFIPKIEQLGYTGAIALEYRLDQDPRLLLQGGDSKEG